MESDGGDGRIGDELGGSIPGSVVAHFHSEYSAISDEIMEM